MFWLNEIDYISVHRLQTEFFQQKKQPANKFLRTTEVWFSSRFPQASLRSTDNILLLCEHNPGVYTVGRRGITRKLQKKGHFLPHLMSSHPAPDPFSLTLEPSLLGDIQDENGLKTPVFHTYRGGGGTYQGPGQLLVYFIADIIDLFKLSCGGKRSTFTSPLRWFMWVLEESIIHTVEFYGIRNTVRHASTAGVWVEEAKIGSIGLQLSRWISMHGLSLNVERLCERYLKQIVICEQPETLPVSIQSLQQDKNPDLTFALTSGRKIHSREKPVEEVAENFVYFFMENIGYTPDIIQVMVQGLHYHHFCIL